MTSSRSQNVSVHQRPDINLWDPSVRVFSDTREGLRSDPRNISLRTDKNTFRWEKSFGPNSSMNFLTSPSRNKDRNTGNKYSKAVITNDINYSSTINSVNRELSPVRWCDREVDGVYLGRSGWVQVQHRSLDDYKEVQYNANSAFSGVPPWKNNSDLNPNCKMFYERRERDKSCHLPLSPKKRIFRDNHVRPSKFIQDFESLSPPSITPVISPPPAFKDGGSETEFSSHTVGKPFFCQRSSLQESDVVVNTNSPPSPQINKQHTLNSFSSAIPTLSSTSSNHQRPPNQDLRTKSFEDDCSVKISHGRRLDSTIPLTLFGFRSLDNDMRITEGLKVKANLSDFRYKDFVKSGRKKKKKEEEEYDFGNEEPVTGRPFSELQSSSCEELSEQRLLSKAQGYFQNTEEVSMSDKNCNAYRVRSSSLDSNSGSTSSSCSSDGFIDKKSGKKVLRKINSNLKSKFEKAQDKNPQHFNVKRSKSLQLSDKKSTNDSFLLNNSDFLESLDFQFKNQNRERATRFPESLHHVLVTVNGESIPVVASSSQSLKSSSKMTTSGVEQKKLIMEMEKEAKIISEFMKGSRSRLAARNLLMDRYFNRYKDEDPANPQNQQSCANCTHFDEDDFRKKNQSCPSSVDRAQRFASHSQTHGQTFCKSNNRDQRKLEVVNNQESERSHIEQTSCTDYCSKRKRQNLNFLSFGAFVNSKTQKEKPVPYLSPNQKMENDKRQITEKQKSETSEIKSFLKSDAQKSFTKRGTGIEERKISIGACGENSLFSSSSSDICKFNFNTTFKRNSEIIKRTNLKNYVTISNSNIFRELSRSRPGSAPEKDFWVSDGVDKRSLSLPRSFLSECYKLNNPFQRKPTVEERLNSPACVAASEKSKRFPSNSRERRTTSINKNLLNISAQPSETTPRKFEKRPSSKHLSLRGYLKGRTERISQGSEDESCENSNETLSVASGEIYGFPGLNNEHDDISKSTCRFVKRKGLKNEIYDSHDSGIQMVNRGNVDSSESQDTDIQEDVDSSYRMTDLQKRIKFKKHNSDIIVWRSNSDLIDESLLNSNVKHCKRNTKVMRKTPIMGDSIILVKYEKFLKPRLRRSLSQPLGLNESLPKNLRRRFSTLEELTLSEDEKDIRQRNIENELLSDSESSATSLSKRKKSFDPVSGEETVVLAEALWDHVAMESCELPFKAGDVIEVLDMGDRNWWWGAANENNGYFPSTFVRLRVSQADTVEDCLAKVTKGKSASKQLRRGKSLSLLSNDQVRSRIVKELLNTERDFVKILRDVKDGYVVQCKQKTDMFTSAQITTIFSNLEDLLLFQERFLKDLEERIDRKFPYKSCFGEVFLNHVSGFRMYSEYCNSHPMAIATLQDLCQENKYCKFFESCRLKQRLIEIPLDGFLLTPVQRICKYPLQLGELLKYTRLDHPDYENVRAALETMRSVATLINERKRKMESLEKLAAWQQRVEGWEGEDLIEISSQLIHQGDVIRITSGMWTSNITLFLFDHQIIYCKKDLLKKNVHIYKGRFLLEESDVIDLPDGKNQQLGINIKFGLKISSRLKDKWLVFCCKSGEDKFQWLEALAKEKILVAQDKEEGLDLPTTAKQLAKMAARTKKSPPFQRKSKNKVSSKCDILFCRNNYPSPSKSKSIKRMGTWFTFGGVMKSSKASLRSRTSGYRFI